MFLMRGVLGLSGLGGQAHVGPFVGASPKEQIAPGGLAPVESVPHKGDIEERLQWERSLVISTLAGATGT